MMKRYSSDGAACERCHRMANYITEDENEFELCSVCARRHPEWDDKIAKSRDKEVDDADG